MTERADPILAATTQIVIAWLESNAIAPAALPGVIRAIYSSLTDLESAGSGGEPATVRGAQPRTAVDIRKSVFADHLVCLEDGNHVTLLKRHLRTAHGLTPELYRAKWNLPSNYPMVTPNYTKTRSRLAKEAGLGRGGRPRK